MLAILLSTVEYVREQPTRQSFAVVVPDGHDSVDDVVLSLLAEAVAVELDDSSSSPASSSSVSEPSALRSSLRGLGQSPDICTPKTLTQGSSNFGRPGKTAVQSKTTPAAAGTLQTTTAPPQAGHQMTGTTVGLSSLVVVIQVLAVMSLDVISSVDTPVGTVVMVEVTAGVACSLFDVADSESVEDVVMGAVVALPSMVETVDV